MGKKITPSVGWEVPVSILGSASGIGAEAVSSTRASSRGEGKRYGSNLRSIMHLYFHHSMLIMWILHARYSSHG